jgi:hypothetical protein
VIGKSGFYSTESGKFLPCWAKLNYMGEIKSEEVAFFPFLWRESRLMT